MKSLTLFRSSIDKKTNQVFGMLIAQSDSSIFTCDTIERPWRSNIKSLSCVLPPPKQKAEHNYKVVNLGGSNAFPIIQLDIKRGDNKIQATYNSPIWVGMVHVLCKQTNRYEFADFRKTLQKLCGFLTHNDMETGVLQVDWTNTHYVDIALDWSQTKDSNKSTFMEIREEYDENDFI